LPSDDSSKITELDDESPSSDPDEFEDNLLENKDDSSKRVIDSSMDSKSDEVLNPACEIQVSVDVFGSDVLAELSIVDDMNLAYEFSDELTSTSIENNGAA